MIYLVLSILCSTLIFVIFKLFTRFEINNLFAIITNYLVASALGILLVPAAIHLKSIAQYKWIWGAVAIGFLFITLFQLMAKGAQTLGVSRVSVAVKMSVVLPVVAGIRLYGEKLHPVAWAGIILALLAVYFGTHKSKSAIKKANVWLLPLVLFIGCGLIDVLLKYAQVFWLQPNEEALFSAILFGSAFVWGLIFSSLQIVKTAIWPKWRDVLGGILLGIPNYGSIYFLLKALDGSGWPSAAIYPVNNVAIVLLSAIFGVFFFKEHLSRMNKLGVASGILAIILISLAK